MKLEEWKTVTNIFANVIGAGALVIGGLFAGYQYLDKVETDRTQMTMTFVEPFHKTQIQEALERITVVWDSHEAEMNEILEGPDEENRVWNSFILTRIKEDNIKAEVLSGIDFYRLLQVCVRNKVCNSKIAREFFGTEARKFFTIHVPFICKRRKELNDSLFASELQEFVGPFRDDPCRFMKD